MTTDFDTYERDLWAGRAEAYERVFAKLTAHMVGPLLDAASVGAGTRVLDVGAGPGIVSAEATRRGAEVSALDADPGMVETARRNVPGLDVRVAVLPDLPFEEGTFDAVVGNFVINHVGRPGEVIGELRRMLRPGGQLALTCWQMPGGVPTVVADAMEEAGVVRPDDIPEPPFQEHAERGAFERLVAGAGFPGATAVDVKWDHRVDPDLWWEGTMARVGTNGVILGRQDEATLLRVRAAFDRLVAVYVGDDGLATLPAHALLAHGART
ncbi:class I SAM-dependent methyltransferase [Spirillospora sp. CA-294931]|uniref:class I SAM-dependent methyltransferase n=1 Tax=Spirillospora sp. CA-294931 TaxID=3240042 RepID=UPI003D93ACB8